MASYNVCNVVAIYNPAVTAVRFFFFLQSKTGQAIPCNFMPDPVFGLHHSLSPLAQLYENLQQNAATTVTDIITLACAISCGFIRDRTHANICSSRSISALILKETSSHETINQNKAFPRLNSLQNSLKASCHPWTTLCLLTKHSACLPSGKYCTSSIMHKLTNHKEICSSQNSLCQVILIMALWKLHEILCFFPCVVLC